MKTLYLLRHAKSSWDDPELKDFERPVNKRGLRDVPVIAGRFLARSPGLGCIMCSPAVRARTTAQLMAENINFPVSNILSNPELYFAGTGMLLKAARSLDEHCEAAMLIGHNPAITEFANLMTGSDIANIPTCGMVGLRIPQNSWQDIEPGSAELEFFDYPKRSSKEDDS